MIFFLFTFKKKYHLQITPCKLEQFPVHDRHTLIITTPAASLCLLVHFTQMLDKALLLTQKWASGFIFPSFLPFSPSFSLSLLSSVFFFFPPTGTIVRRDEKSLILCSHSLRFHFFSPSWSSNIMPIIRKYNSPSLTL